MAEWLNKYRLYFRNRKFLFLAGGGFLFLVLSIIISFFAIIYATDRASGPVTDIILSNLPVFDVDMIFVYGPVLFWILVAGYLVFEPKKIPFTLKSIALFIVIRSIFISLTHIGPFPVHDQITTSGLLGVFTSGNDLFFSGHTGLPFLMALVFWDNKYLRWFFIAASIFFGAIVLMAHLHYSIDVFAAFFITYAISHIAEVFFKKDRKIFNEGIPVRNSGLL
ncbi:MAG: phosphatase PAP2-related protein [Minisyncoccia bacterium]